MKTCGISTAFVAVAWGWLAFAQAAQERPADKAPSPAEAGFGAREARGDGLRVVHVGNSHSHALRFLEPLAWAVGHAKHKDGEINVLGAPLRWN